MNIHEYQAKQIFSEYAIPVPLGNVVYTVKDAINVAKKLGGDSWMVKAQVYTGGRGKVGGVKKVQDLAELESFVANLLGRRLVTKQTTNEGQPVNAILIEQPCVISKELYLSAVIDRKQQRVAFIASTKGGMDIEEVAVSQPNEIFTVFVDPVVGLQSYQCRQFAFSLGLEKSQVSFLCKIMQGLYRAFIDKDLSLVEINPLVVTEHGELLAVDAKINVDDNAMFRQAPLFELFDPTQEDEKEIEAKRFGLNYITLDGNIACMVNGAGLAMATMDIIKIEGGEPANFLDVGGGTTADRVAEAFKIILSDSKVKAILVNIFGGIVRCDIIANGIIDAVKEVSINIPVIVRLEGTNAQEGLKLLAESGLAITSAESFTDAARRAVSEVRGAA